MTKSTKIRSVGYYLVKPLLPRSLQLSLRRLRCRKLLRSHSGVWPIDASASRKPPAWPGWPEGKKFALVLTHDVESPLGQKKCLDLAELEQSHGLRSSFNFVARSYSDLPELRSDLIRRGFEVGLHGLYHNGFMYASEAIFRMHARYINRYLKDWGCVGFRSPAMHHNLDWTSHLDVLYDSSTFDTDPFEPQPDGVQSIFPMWLQPNSCRPGYVELPYTLPQDFTLFVILQVKSIDIWKRKLDWIAEHGGMALLLTHPDYMTISGAPNGREEYPVKHYAELLEYMNRNYRNQYWHALPREVAEFWRRVYGRRDRTREEPSASARPKRVCMLSYSFYETDNRVTRYAESLARRGNRVDVICLRRAGQPRSAVSRGVRIFRIQERTKNERGMVSYLLRLMGFLLRSSVSLSWRHLKDRYDIVHVHNIPDFEVFAALLPKLTGCKVILDIHDIVPELFCDKFKTSPRSMFFRLLVAAERMSAKFSDHVIISNDIWLQSIVRRSVQREKCSVILNYPDPSIFSAARYPRDNGSRQIILYPGSLNQHQGLDIAIGAFALIRDRIPNADLHIYGEGPAKPALSRMIKDLRLEDRVLLRDSLPMEEVAKVMANAACGIVPKRAHGFGNEAFSTKILEFMALGVPLIVSETRIDRFYFNDDLVLYFRSEDERDLGDKIVTLLQNEHLRMRLVSNALQFIAKNSWDTKEQDYLSLINRLCGVESATRLTVGE